MQLNSHFPDNTSLMCMWYQFISPGYLTCIYEYKRRRGNRATEADRAWDAIGKMNQNWHRRKLKVKERRKKKIKTYLSYERLKQKEEREELNLSMRGVKAHGCDEKDNTKYNLKGKKRDIYVCKKKTNPKQKTNKHTKNPPQKLHERK